VEGPALLGKLADGAEAELVVAPVEVALVQAVGDGVVGLRREHQPAQYGLLDLHRLRRYPQLVHALLGAGFETWCGVPEAWACAHRSPVLEACADAAGRR